MDMPEMSVSCLLFIWDILSELWDIVQGNMKLPLVYEIVRRSNCMTWRAVRILGTYPE